MCVGMGWAGRCSGVEYICGGERIECFLRMVLAICDGLASWEGGCCCIVIHLSIHPLRFFLEVLASLMGGWVGKRLNVGLMIVVYKGRR